MKKRLHKDLINKIDREAMECLERYIPKLSVASCEIEYKKGDLKDRKTYFGCDHETGKIEVYSSTIFDRFHEDFLDDEIINPNFDINMKRKNIYLIALIHERAEASYCKYRRKIRNSSELNRFYAKDAHAFAVNVELFILKKLIEDKNLSSRDRRDFLRRYRARLKDLRVKF